MELAIIVVLLIFSKLAELNGNDVKDSKFTSYLIEHNIRSFQDGEETRWSLDLNGTYIIESVRIHVAEYSTWNSRNFSMTVNQTFAANQSEKLHKCDQIFFDENGWIIIKCKESVVIGSYLTIKVISGHATHISKTLNIDICSLTKYPILSHFKTDSSFVKVGIHSLFDGDFNSCIPMTDTWFDYSNWISYDLEEEVFVGSLIIMGKNYAPVTSFNVLISNRYTVDIFPNDIVCNASNYFLSCFREGRFITLKNLSNIGMESTICEILISGSRKYEKLSKEYEICNFTSNGKFDEGETVSKAVWMVPLIILCCSFLFGLCFWIWSICRKKPRFSKKHFVGSNLINLHANGLQHVINRRLLLGEFDKEFTKLPKSDVKPSIIAANHALKNRFANVVPFDDNLVSLEGHESNYINASFITGYGGIPKAYIATQGPKHNTLIDFWNLVWQYEVDVIVMLVLLSEDGVDTCGQYWPDIDQHELIFDKVSVTIAKEIEFADYIRRNLVVKMINQPKKSPRAVVHMHFLAWTDDHVPFCYFSLLNFREKVISLQKHSKSPLLVHCSGGVGRTGIYIAIDYLIKQAEAEGKVSVYKCVKELRLQRMNMVQNKRQYIFIYKSLIEVSATSKMAMYCIDFIMRFHGLVTQGRSSENLIRVIKNESEKNLKKVVQINFERTPVGARTINLLRNRQEAAIENGDHTLCNNIGASCVRFLNAVSIQCHKMSNACILTEIPHLETRPNFWQMLWENDIGEFLLLIDDNNCAKYWPEQDAVAFGSLTVCLTSEEESGCFVITRKFILVDNDKVNPLGENVKEITQFQVTRHLWSEHSQVPTNKRYFQKILKQLVNSKKRTVLQCLDGSSRCGLTAAAMLMIDMILLDEVVDPFLACRYVLASRPEAISQEQFTFLYELALECIEDSGNYNFLRSSEYDLEREL